MVPENRNVRRRIAATWLRTSVIGYKLNTPETSKEPAAASCHKNSKSPVPDPAAATDDNALAFEANIRKLIADLKSKTALESAKQFHKTQKSAPFESLLLEAYLARIQSLRDQNLAPSNRLRVSRR